MDIPMVTPVAAGHTSGRCRAGVVEITAAFVLASALCAIGVAVGYAAFVPEATLDGPAFTLTGTTLAIFTQILARNLSAAGLLASGYLTMGISTVLGLLLTSTWVGATMHAIAASGGAAGATVLTWIYVAIEFAGVLVAATAGLLVPTRHLAGAVNPVGPSQSVTATFLKLAGLTTALIVLAAALETTVIVSRS